MGDQIQSVVPVVTVDGPSGAGKGTICRLLSEATGYSLLDSGALYRLTALSCLSVGVDCNDEARAAEVAANLDIRFDVVPGGTHVLLAGKDVSKDIRTEEVGLTASKVAAHPLVRDALLQRQKVFQKPPGLVADGRDMGTEVFPGAQLKIFLTASAEERAKRRVKQLEEGGVSASYEDVLSDIVARDEKDSSRASSPLRAADDAVLLDSTALTIEQVFQAIVRELKNRSLLSD